jgi:ribosomal protein L7/L12
MSNNLNDEIREEIKAAIFAGRKIEAIKLYRDATGLGLKEAKEFIDKLQAALKKESPESFTANSAGGCAGSFVVLIGLIFLFKTMI